MWQMNAANGGFNQGSEVKLKSEDTEPKRKRRTKSEFEADAAAQAKANNPALHCSVPGCVQSFQCARSRANHMRKAGGGSTYQSAPAECVRIRHESHKDKDGWVFVCGTPHQTLFSLEVPQKKETMEMYLQQHRTSLTTDLAQKLYGQLNPSNPSDATKKSDLAQTDNDKKMASFLHLKSVSASGDEGKCLLNGQVHRMTLAPSPT